ncbi:MAG: peptidase S58 family protein [Methanobacteriota archaeon]|nr:MAG: peptidase S58 family protein [Euryarchaeota archaeon]
MKAELFQNLKVKVGHATHPEEATGCTVVIAPEGAVAGVDVRGSAPGTRETDLLRPTFMIRKIHAVVLTGGSAFGLRTVDGAMKYLSEHGIGYDARGTIIPIIPAAVIFDLREGRSTEFPDMDMGYQACAAAGYDFEEGLVGVGKGATVGKVLGMDYCMNGGFGSASVTIGADLSVAALVAVNALGDVINPETGQIVAGARNPSGRGFADARQMMLDGKFGSPLPESNTTLGVVITNGKFSKEEMNKIAMMAQNGIARAIRPVHTMYDGDIIFALSTGEVAADINVVGEAAAYAVSQAIVNTVQLTNAQ